MLSINRYLVPVLVGLVIVSLAILVKVADLGPLKTLEHRLELMAFDQRMRMALPDVVEPDTSIVIIDIDEKSLAAEGHWPWPRNKLAKLVDKLFENKISILGFDILFPEAERNAATQILSEIPVEVKNNNPDLLNGIKKLGAYLDHDDIFARSLNGKPVVIGYSFTNRDVSSIGQLPDPVNITSHNSLKHLEIGAMQNYIASIPVLQRAAQGGGFITVIPDTDGIIRRVPLILQYANHGFTSLALEVARIYLGIEDVRIITATIGDNEGIEYISLGGFIDIPVDGEGRVLVPYKGGSGSYQYISATDVLNEKVDRSMLEGSIALLGTTASGMFDFRAAPVQSVYPGVEIQANVISGILNETFPYKPAWAKGVDIAILLGLGVLMSLLLPRMSPVWIVVFTLLVISSYIYINMWIWSNKGLAMSIAMPVIMLLTLSTANMAYGFLFESKGRRQMKDRFGQYIPPELVEELYDHPDTAFGLEGDSREMTVLFADIRNFTTISESLPANELKQLLNFFFTPMTRIIFNNRGTIDKYVGDMIMAFWGAPLEDNQQQANAIKAALEMLKKVEEIKNEIKERGWPEVNIGIGLNTGTMNVGDMGSEFRRAYTVIGDAVNLGSRLEGLTKFYGVGLIVSESTCKDQDQFLFRRLDKVKVKGKDEAVEIYEPICLRHEADETLLDELTRHDEAYELYLSMDWEESEKKFQALNEGHPRKIYSIYLERIHEFQISSPGSEWDGVFEHLSK